MTFLKAIPGRAQACVPSHPAGKGSTRRGVSGAFATPRPLDHFSASLGGQAWAIVWLAGDTAPRTRSGSSALCHRPQAASRGRHVSARAAADGGAGPSSPVPDTLPAMEAGADWRAFRAALVSASAGDGGAGAGPAAGERWAHPLSAPEQGCLLLAHPLMFTTSQGYFNKSVILVFSHDANGSAGLILNM